MRFAAVALLVAIMLVAVAGRDSAPARAITGPMGVIQTYMGTGVPGNTGDAGAPAAATITGPNGIAVAPNGDLYVSSGCVVRRVHASVVTTVADVCALSSPSPILSGVAISPSGDVDFGMDCVVMKVTTGAPVVAAGDPLCGGQPCGCTGTFVQVGGIAFDRTGNLFVADWHHCVVKKVDTGGIITTVVGTGSGAPFSCSNTGDGGLATAATLDYPLGVTVADNGDLYVATGEGNGIARIRKVSHGIISTFAGGPCCALGDGGPATSASVQLSSYLVSGMVVDQTGDLYLADAGNCRVRRVSRGVITTIAGNGSCAAAGDGGQATNASMHPVDVALDSDGTLYIADGYDGSPITPNNLVRTVFGVALDSDQDGYTDQQETAIGKDPMIYCPIMRADVDGDGTVTILDLAKVAGFFGQMVPPAPPRYRQGPPPFGSAINILDLSKMAMQYYKTVSACP
jgi:sugar lactone lactonase YvrE